MKVWCTQPAPSSAAVDHSSLYICLYLSPKVMMRTSCFFQRLSERDLEARNST